MMKIEWYATKKLKEMREELGLTQKEMANYIGLKTGKPISESLYQKWELGDQNLQAMQVIDLGKILNIDWKELVIQK